VSVASIEISRYDRDTAVVILHGQHDLSTREEFEAKLRSLLHADNRVIVDFSVTEFIDSSVLNALLQADKLATERGHRVVLQLGTARSVALVLDVSGLLDRIPCASTREKAIELAWNNHQQRSVPAASSGVGGA
jgi:anti-anti-sigma factor